MIQTKTLNKLIETHAWTAILECLPQTDDMVLVFPDPDALESFRAFVYQKNAYEKHYRLSVNRKKLEVNIARLNEGDQD